MTHSPIRHARILRYDEIRQTLTREPPGSAVYQVRYCGPGGDERAYFVVAPAGWYAPGDAMPVVWQEATEDLVLGPVREGMATVQGACSAGSEEIVVTLGFDHDLPSWRIGLRRLYAKPGTYYAGQRVRVLVTDCGEKGGQHDQCRRCVVPSGRCAPGWEVATVRSFQREDDGTWEVTVRRAGGAGGKISGIDVAGLTLRVGDEVRAYPVDDDPFTMTLRP